MSTQNKMVIKNRIKPLFTGFFLFQITLLVIAFEVQTAASAPPISERWVLNTRLSDEFNDPILNKHQWFNRNPFWPGSKPALFVPDNVQLNKGLLQLYLRYQDHAYDLPGYHSFSSAHILSKHKIRYGYLEIKAKALNANAISAFWLHRDTTWGSFKISIAEMISNASDQENSITTKTEYFYGNPADATEQTTMTSSQQWHSSQSLSKDFVILALDWNAKQLNWFINDKLIRSEPNNHWHTPMSVSLDVQLDVKHLGSPGFSLLPAVFNIDYIRVWQRQEGNNMPSKLLRNFKLSPRYEE